MAKAIMWVVLLTAMLGSALAVIYSKYHSRMLFSNIQELEKKLDQYELKWGQLQLEMTTLIEHSRIEQAAKQKLDMIEPVREKIVHVRP